MLSVVVILRFGIFRNKGEKLNVQKESNKHGIYTKTCFNHYIYKQK